MPSCFAFLPHPKQGSILAPDLRSGYGRKKMLPLFLNFRASSARSWVPRSVLSLFPLSLFVCECPCVDRQATPFDSSTSAAPPKSPGLGDPPERRSSDSPPVVAVCLCSSFGFRLDLRLWLVAAVRFRCCGIFLMADPSFASAVDLGQPGPEAGGSTATRSMVCLQASPDGEPSTSS